MLIEAIITPDQETSRKMHMKVTPLINFRAAARKATEQLLSEIKKTAPRATGDFVASIDSTFHEYDDPYRIVCRVYSTHKAADVIEFGAEPHTVPIREILRWMQAVNMKVQGENTVEGVAHKIQQKIEEKGIKPHYTFTNAYDSAENYYQDAIDPIIDALGGEADYDFELRSSGSYPNSYE